MFPRVGGDHDDDDHIDNPATNSVAEEYCEEWSLNISFMTTSPHSWQIAPHSLLKYFKTKIFLKPNAQSGSLCDAVGQFIIFDKHQ